MTKPCVAPQGSIDKFRIFLLYSSNLCFSSSTSFSRTLVFSFKPSFSASNSAIFASIDATRPAAAPRSSALASRSFNSLLSVSTALSCTCTCTCSCVFSESRKRNCSRPSSYVTSLCFAAASATLMASCLRSSFVSVSCCRSRDWTVWSWWCACCASCLDLSARACRSEAWDWC